MAYPVDFPNAARRHYAAADMLSDGSHTQHQRRRDVAVAGYLYGIAAECALKRMMAISGMRPLASEHRRDDPFYAHFPELKTLLRDAARGRLEQRLVGYATNGALMSEWDVSMRYAPGKEIAERFVDRWRAQAKDLVEAMEG